MTYRVTLGAGLRSIVMPNGLRYQGGDQVVLSDEWYAELSSGFSGSFTSASLGDAEWTVTLKTGLRGIALPNGLAYHGGASVTLSDDQYSLLRPAVITALFSSSVMEAGS